MANHKSADKRNRQNIKKAARNTSLKSNMKTTIRNFREAAQNEDPKTSELYKKVVSTIAKLSSKGLLHKKTASRKISRLSKLTK